MLTLDKVARVVVGRFDSAVAVIARLNTRTGIVNFMVSVALRVIKIDLEN